MKHIKIPKKNTVMPSGEYVIIRHLIKKFGEDTVLSDINMTMEEGMVYGISGNNGSGKTVLMKCICGFVPVTEGSITVGGKMIGTQIDFPESIGVIIETPGFLTNLTGIRNLEILAGLKGNISKEDIRAAIQKAGLDPDLKKSVGKYSLGMRQRLGIAVALAGDPDFLVLDEPVNGLDPQGIIEMRELILKLNRERQITVLISSHILDELSRLATHYGFIDGGRIMKEMSAEELENACRKCIHVTVSDTAALARVLESRSMDYEIHSATEADVFAKFNVSQLASALEKEHCEIISMQERDESLESYYMSLVNGRTHSGSGSGR